MQGYSTLKGVVQNDPDDSQAPVACQQVERRPNLAPLYKISISLIMIAFLQD